MHRHDLLVDGVLEASCIEDIPHLSFLIAMVDLQLNHSKFAWGLLLVIPQIGWFELHLNLVVCLCELAMPLQAFFQGCCCVPPRGVLLVVDEDAVAAHVLFGEVELWAIDGSDCQQIWDLPDVVGLKSSFP